MSHNRSPQNTMPLKINCGDHGIVHGWFHTDGTNQTDGDTMAARIHSTLNLLVRTRMRNHQTEYGRTHTSRITAVVGYYKPSTEPMFRVRFLKGTEEPNFSVLVEALARLEGKLHVIVEFDKMDAVMDDDA